MTLTRLAVGFGEVVKEQPLPGAGLRGSVGHALDHFVYRGATGKGAIVPPPRVEMGMRVDQPRYDGAALQIDAPCTRRCQLQDIVV